MKTFFGVRWLQVTRVLTQEILIARLTFLNRFVTGNAATVKFLGGSCTTDLHAKVTFAKKTSYDIKKNYKIFVLFPYLNMELITSHVI